MKKISNTIFAYLSLLTMIIGFFLPNFTYIVKATEGVERNQTLFNGVTNNTVYLDMEDNTKVEITATENIQSINYCYSNVADAVATITYTENKCTIESKFYGKTMLYLEYSDINGISQTEAITIDVEFDKFVDTLYNSLPDEYEYKEGEDFSTYLNNMVPSFASVYYAPESQSECYSSVSDGCDVVLSVNYHEYDSTNNTINYRSTERTKHIKKVDNIQENNGFNYISTQYVGVGESIKPDISVDGISTDYFFVSEDNTIARIDESNKLVGVSPGHTNIRIVNKETLEYASFTVVVNSIYASRTINEILDIFKDTVSIDISNNLNLSYGSNASYVAARYFEAIAKNANGNMGYSGTTASYCADETNLKDCNIEYYYYSNGSGQINGKTQNFDIEYRGIRVNWISGYYVSGSFGKYDYYPYYYMHKNNTIHFTDITNYESDLLYSVDDEYLEIIEDMGTVSFKAKKEGYTKITLYSTSGYMTSIPIYIKYTQEEFDNFKTELENITSIDVPYTQGTKNKDELNNYISAYIKERVTNKRLANSLELSTILLPNGNVLVSGEIKDRHITLYSPMFDQSITINYLSTSNEFIDNNLSLFKDQIKEKYTVSLKDTINLLEDITNYDDFYQNLYHSSQLQSDLNYEGLTTKVEFMDIVKQNNYLIGGAYYTVYIYYNNQLIDQEKVIVLCNQTIDREITDTEKDDTTYINDYIREITGKTHNIQHAFDNYYLLNINENKVYLLYDHKNKIQAQQSSVYGMNPDVIELDVGEQTRFKYTISPFTATYFDMKFQSSNEDVFTIDKKGNITATGNGVAFISYSNGYYINKHPVLVGTTITEYFDSILNQMNLNDIKVDYRDVEYGLEDAIIWALDYELYKYEDTHGLINFSPRFQYTRNGNNLEISMCLNTQCSSTMKGKYRLVGIHNGTDDKKYHINVGETIKSNIKFSEADTSNLLYSVEDSSIAKVDKHGNITGLKQGATSLSVFDKFHTYLNEFYIYVDFDNYIDKLKEETSNKEFEIDGYYINNVFDSTSAIIDQVTNQLEEMGYHFRNIILGVDGFGVIYNEETGEVTYELADANGEYMELTVKTKLVGIHTSRDMVQIEQGYTYTDDFKTYNEGTVTLKSSNPEVCTINGTSITGVGKGICHVTYQLGNYKDVQTIVVNPNAIKEDLNIMLESLPSEIEVPLDPYDTEKSSDYDYINYYDVFLYNYFEQYYPEGSKYYVNPTSISISETGDEIAISLAYQDEVFSGGEYQNRYITESEQKKVTLHFTGHSEDWEEEGKRIASQLKEEYILTPEQMMDYTFSSGNLEELHEYSSFMDDLEKACPDCSIMLGGRGGVDGGNGVVNIGFQYYIIKNNEPIGFGDVMIYGYLYLDLLEIEDDKHIEREVKERFKEAYKKHKHHKALYSPLTRFKADESETKIEDDYEVELTLTSKDGNLYNYDVEIDGNTYKTSVYLNILTKDLKYDTAIQDIKIDKTILNLAVGESEQINATINPKEATEKLIWKSNNEIVAKVVDGKVTALSYGTAIITVESESGDVKKTIYVSVIDYKLPGDIDGDGKINVLDLVKLRKHLANLEKLTGDALKGADINKDDAVNIMDLVNMRQHLAK